MKSIVLLIVELFRLLFKSKQDLILENLILRKQLNIYKRKNKRPKLENIDRIILVWISRIFKELWLRRYAYCTRRSPWQNPICERVIGTLRRECLDHMIILNEKHLYNVLHEYIFDYYNVSRTHLSLEKDSPVHRKVQKIRLTPVPKIWSPGD